MAAGSREIEFGDNPVQTVTLGGDDSIDLIDIDSIDGAGVTVAISGLDGGDRVELANDVALTGGVTINVESGAEQDNPIILSLEDVDITTNALTFGADIEAARIEATGDDASSIADLVLDNDDTELLELAGDQALTIVDVSVADSGALETIDASQADGGVTIGEYNTTTSEFDDWVYFLSVTDYDGSSAADLLGLDGVGASANIDLAGGDDILDLGDSVSTIILGGSVVISAGSGADVVDLAHAEIGNSAADTLTVDLGAADGAADKLVVNEVTTGTDNKLTVQNFEAGVDTLDVSANGTDFVVIANGSASTSVGVTDSDTTGTDVELQYGLNVVSEALSVDDLTVSADVAAALAVDVSYAADGDDVYVMVNNGTDAALYMFADDPTAGIAADGSEATLVAVFEGTPDMTAIADSSTSFVDFA